VELNLRPAAELNPVGHRRRAQPGTISSIGAFQAARPRRVAHGVQDLDRLIRAVVMPGLRSHRSTPLTSQA
jgi:hypothetical protein